MTEKILIKLNDHFQLEVEATNPEQGESDDFQPVDEVQDLTPYGMLLSGLGSCTAMVIMTYANNHQLDLDQVGVRLEYQRVFKDDCDNCERIDRYEEQIFETLEFSGDLTKESEDKLHKIARHCPVEKMLKQGVEVIPQNS